MTKKRALRNISPLEYKTARVVGNNLFRYKNLRGNMVYRRGYVDFLINTEDGGWIVNVAPENINRELRATLYAIARLHIYRNGNSWHITEGMDTSNGVKFYEGIRIGGVAKNPGGPWGMNNGNCGGEEDHGVYEEEYPF